MSGESDLTPTRIAITPTLDMFKGDPPLELAKQYAQLTSGDNVSWTIDYRLLSKLGQGGQGDVFLADRIGAYGSTFRLALKFFRPDGYPSTSLYQQEMGRLARTSMEMARLQQDHLLDVYNAIDLDGILVLATEWVDGYDLGQLLSPVTLQRVKDAVDRHRWEYVNDVIVTQSESRLRLKPGIAIAILRECLAGLAALHRQGIVHSDIKPGNLMIKRTGNCKIIDFGSAFELAERPYRSTWTPRYAAVEVLKGAEPSPRSDLASLGYTLYEMLIGEHPFQHAKNANQLKIAKRELHKRLDQLLPQDVAANSTLLHLLSRLISPDPADRFETAEQADLDPRGAAEFQRELIRSHMASEYVNDIRLLMQELEEPPEDDVQPARRTG